MMKPGKKNKTIDGPTKPSAIVGSTYAICGVSEAKVILVFH